MLSMMESYDPNTHYLDKQFFYLLVKVGEVRENHFY